jgi:hypothetical protein
VGDDTDSALIAFGIVGDFDNLIVYPDFATNTSWHLARLP